MVFQRRMGRKKNTIDQNPEKTEILFTSTVFLEKKNIIFRLEPPQIPKRPPHLQHFHPLNPKIPKKLGIPTTMSWVIDYQTHLRQLIEGPTHPAESRRSGFSFVWFIGFRWFSLVYLIPYWSISLAFYCPKIPRKLEEKLKNL